MGLGLETGKQGQMESAENRVILGAFVGNSFWQHHEEGIGVRGLLTGGAGEEAKVEANGSSTGMNPVLVGVGGWRWEGRAGWRRNV